jgi:transcriptional regulator with XRE-family HTH domain
MARGRRRAARDLGVREANAIAGNLGRETRRTRVRRRWTQEELGDRTGVSQAEISKLEGGHGGRTSIETWVAIGIALDRPIAIGFSRDVIDPSPQDAGHLAAQELLLRLASAAGWRARVEHPTNASDPRHATDVVLVGVDRRVVFVEIWNRCDDLGAAIRSSDRKLAEAGRGGTDVGSCWLFVDTAANRELVRRYPSILRARFGGSSSGWVSALTGGTRSSASPGVAWIDPRAARLREMRLATP